jgi:hypothetical protein
LYIYRLYITSPRLPITRRSSGQTVQSGRADQVWAAIKTLPRRQGLGFRVVAVPSGVRATTILGASGGTAPRRATDGDAPLGTSDDDALEVGGQAVTARPKRTGGGDAP